MRPVRKWPVLVIAFAGVLGVIIAVALDVGDDSPVTTSTTQAPVMPMVWTNPVLPDDFPDPFVVRDGDGYVAVATNASGRRVQVSTSPDLADWSMPGEALSSMPRWASTRIDLVWAPSIIRLDDRWMMYATFQEASSERQCIGAASATVPSGPYSPLGEQPLVCPVAAGGAIDPEVVLHGDSPTLLWKVDGNCCGKPSVIRSQQLSTDGTALEGAATDLIRLDQPWERGPTAPQSTVEGPSMTRIGGRWVLLYSAGGYAGGGYSMGYAVCDSPAGPCTKPSSAPLLASGVGLSGPGGGSFFDDDDGRTWIAYHAWDPAAVGYESGGRRSMRIDPVLLIGDRLVVLGPSIVPMELPPEGRVPVAVSTTMPPSTMPPTTMPPSTTVKAPRPR